MLFRSHTTPHHTTPHHTTTPTHIHHRRNTHTTHSNASLCVCVRSCERCKYGHPYMGATCSFVRVYSACVQLPCWDLCGFSLQRAFEQVARRLQGLAGFAQSTHADIASRSVSCLLLSSPLLSSPLLFSLLLSSPLLSSPLLLSPLLSFPLLSFPLLSSLTCSLVHYLSQRVFVCVSLVVCSYVGTPRMYVCLYVCMHVRMYVRMHVCVYVCTYVCVCMYVCMYVRTYVYACM